MAFEPSSRKDADIIESQTFVIAADNAILFRAVAADPGEVLRMAIHARVDLPPDLIIRPAADVEERA